MPVACSGGPEARETDAVGGLSQTAEPITWVTASVAYKVNEMISVSLEGRNLADEHFSSYLSRPDILTDGGFETWGRSYILGLAAKF